MNKRIGFGFVAIAVIACGLWLALRPRTAQAPARVADDVNDAASQPTAPSAPEHATPSHDAGSASGAASPHPTPSTGAATAPSERPKAAIRIAFETEPRDATAPAAEAQLRAIYDGEPTAHGVLRDVRCTRTVCKIEARWSRDLNAGYNAALLKVIHAFGKHISLEPDGPPDETATPIAIYVHRPTDKAAAH